MDASIADRLPLWTARLAEWPWVLFVVETLALFVAMAAPFFLLEIGWPLLGAVAVVSAGHVILTVVQVGRQKRGKFEEPQLRFVVLIYAFRLSFMFIAFGALIVVMNGWEYWSFTASPSTQRAYENLWEILGILVAPPVLFLILVRPWGKSTPTADILRAVRNRRFACIRSDWIGISAFVIVCLCSMAVVGNLLKFHQLLKGLHFGKEPPVLEMAVAIPFLPLGLLVVAAMLALIRRMAPARMSSGAIVYACNRADGHTLIPATGKAVVAVLCGWAAVSYVVMAPAHLERIADRSSTAGLEVTLDAGTAIEEWAIARRADGQTGAELAAVLNERGNWSPDAPEVGLPELFPELREKMPAGTSWGVVACSITVAAAEADPAAVRDVEWLLPDESGSDLKFCIRTACPSPVTWDAPDTVVLLSSHGTRNRHWAVNFFIDVFAEGVADEPGGYCTADGALAESYQG